MAREGPIPLPVVPIRRPDAASTVLADLARDVPEAGIQLGELLDRLGQSGRLLVCMVLCVPFLLPVSIPGTSTPFAFLIVLVGIGVLLDRIPWLPARLRSRHLEQSTAVKILTRGSRLFARLEKVAHPRLSLLTHGPTLGRVNAVALIGAAILLMLPLPLPLSNTIPAYSVVFLAAGTVERDGVLIAVGYVLELLALVYFGAVAVFGVNGLERLAGIGGG